MLRKEQPGLLASPGIKRSAEMRAINQIVSEQPACSQSESYGGNDCDRRTQRARILSELVKARAAWVPLPQIIALAAQYNTRIFELRRLGFLIENRTENVNGQRHSWFRLLPNSASVSRATDAPLPGPAPHSKAEPGQGPAGRTDIHIEQQSELFPIVKTWRDPGDATGDL